MDQQPLKGYTQKAELFDFNRELKQKAPKVDSCLTRFADQAPYFLGVGAGQAHFSDADRWFTIIGIVLHWVLWGFVVAYDADLIFHSFNDPEHPYYHVLMLGAWVPLCVAAATVLGLTIIHLSTSCAEKSWLNFNDGHLPGFFTTVILGSIRASATFTLLLLSAAVFTSNQPGNEISTHTRNQLVLQVVLKQIGISFTANAHRFATPGGGFCKAE
tara:strand:+ start:1640 stop:2284 length:645 start_codon:yes stop_codon:yes gene_type:complete